MSYSIKEVRANGGPSTTLVVFKKRPIPRKALKVFSYTLVLLLVLLASHLLSILGPSNPESYLERITVGFSTFFQAFLFLLALLTTSITVLILLVELLICSPLLTVQIGSCLTSRKSLKRLKKDPEFVFELKKMNRALKHLHRMGEKTPSALEKIETQKSKIQELAESKIYSYDIEGSQSEESKENKDHQRDLELKSNILKNLIH